MAVVKKFGHDQGGQPGGADLLLRVLLAVPAAAGVRDDPRVRPGGRPPRPAGGRALGAQPVPDHRRSDPHQRAARACGGAGGRNRHLACSGMGVTQASQNAFDHVWAVPFKDRPDFWQSRLRGLLLLSRAGAPVRARHRRLGRSSRRLGGSLLKVVGILISLLFNFALFLAAFRLLTCLGRAPRAVAGRVRGRGAVGDPAAGRRRTTSATCSSTHQHTYGTFGLVIALLVWLHLGAQVTIYSSELNVVSAAACGRAACWARPPSPPTRRP